MAAPGSEEPISNPKGHVAVRVVLHPLRWCATGHDATEGVLFGPSSYVRSKGKRMAICR